MENKRVSVLLLSAGLDSVVASYLMPHDVKLFIKTGTKDNLFEQRLLAEIYTTHNLEIVDMSFLAKFELPNKIIPYRNYFFVLAAAQFGQDIFLSSTAGDILRDQDDNFFKKISDSLSYCAASGEEVTYTGPIRVYAPVGMYTKTEMVKVFIKTGYDPNILVKHSTSCYYPQDTINPSTGKPIVKECGACRSCLRKFVALFNNGIYPDFNIPSLHQLDALLSEAVANKRGKEVDDIQKAIIRYKGKYL